MLGENGSGPSESTLKPPRSIHGYAESRRQAVVGRMADIIGGDVLSALQPAHHVIHLVGFGIVLVIEAWSRALRQSECSASRKICASDRLADAVAGVAGGPAVEQAAKPI
jgi:hypothetical protein